MHALPVRVITKIEANQLNTKYLHTFCAVSSEHYGSTNRPGSSTSDLRTKGEITSNTVVSQNYKDSRGLVSSLPLFLEITMSRPMYLGRIFLFRAFSIAVFRIRTRSPSLKLKSFIDAPCSSLNLITAFRCAWNTLLCKALRWLRRFCSAIARQVMRSVVDNTESGGGNRYDASMMSKGNSGCVLVTAKYGEHPMQCLTVTLSAQNTE